MVRHVRAERFASATADLVAKVGAILKLGRYRSAAQYFSVAKSFHREAGFEWEPHLDHAVNQAIHSITRGMGPSSVELCDGQFASRVSHTTPSECKSTTVWIRASSHLGSSSEVWRWQRQCVKTSHFRVKEWSSCPCLFPKTTHLVVVATVRTPALVYADMTQDATARGMRPCCSLRCNGANAGQSVCLSRGPSHLSGSSDKSRWHASAPLFGNGSGPDQDAWLARVFAWVLCSQDLHDWHAEVVQRWTQHTFRVSGAQMFARANLDLHVIMLLGRWGSAAIVRYVQEAAIADPTRAAAAVSHRTSMFAHARASQAKPTALAILPSALDQVRAVVADCFRGQGVLVHNVRSRLAHKPCAAQCSTPSSEWLSAFGRWRYGKASCQRNPTLLPGAFLTSPQLLRSLTQEPQRLSQRKCRIHPRPSEVWDAMASASSMPSFADLAARSGVHADVCRLFQARGVTTPRVMFHLFADRTQVEAFLEPLRAGIELDGSTRRRTSDELLVDHATVLDMLDKIAQHRSPPSSQA